MRHRGSPLMNMHGSKCGTGHIWLPRQITYLRRWYGRTEMDRMMETLGRSRSSIYNKARQLGLSSSRLGSGPLWTKEEERFIKQMYGTMTSQAIADGLNKINGLLSRTASAARSKAYILGLCVPKRCRGRIYRRPY